MAISSSNQSGPVPKMTFAEAPIEQRAPLPYLPDVRAGPYGERRPPAPAQRSGPLKVAAD